MNTDYTARRVLARRDEMEARLSDIAGEGYEVEVLRESFARVVDDLLKFEDQGWVQLLGDLEKDVKGFSLKDVKKTTTYLEKQTKILGDLLGRGLRLKNNHAFGRGCSFEPNPGRDKIAPRHQAIIDDPYNQEEVFSLTAMKEINRIIFTSGNIFLMYDKAEKTWSRLAVDQNIENYITYDDNPTRIKYILRQWSSENTLNAFGQKVVQQEWVPTSTYDTPSRRYPATIKYGTKNVPVARRKVIIHRAYNRDNGETWGVPDAFAAAAPAHVYATAMKDGAMLQHALAAISFVVKAKTQAAAKRAGAQMRNNKVGQAAITGPETEITSLPRAGSINLYESRPLAARVAAALDVSTTGLTSDPGPGGSYASENALSAPEQMAALSRQEDFMNLFKEIFRVMGAEAFLNFKRLDVDPIHRQAQTLGIFRNLGALSQKEIRGRALELTDIEGDVDDLPEPDEFTGSKYSTLKGQVEAGLVDQPGEAPIGTQGSRTGVGSLDDANSARDE